MQRTLANTMTLSCSSLLKRGEAAPLCRAWAMTMLTHQNSLQSYDFCKLCEPRKCGFHFSTIICRKCKVCWPNAVKDKSKALFLIVASWSEEKRATVRSLRNDDDVAKKRHKLMISVCFAQHAAAATVLILVQFFATLSAEQQNMTHSFYVSL